MLNLFSSLLNDESLLGRWANPGLSPNLLCPNPPGLLPNVLGGLSSLGLIPNTSTSSSFTNAAFLGKPFASQIASAKIVINNDCDLLASSLPGILNSIPSGFAFESIIAKIGIFNFCASFNAILSSTADDKTMAAGLCLINLIPLKANSIFFISLYISTASFLL